MSRAKCIFCEILAGRLESSRVYEDERILAFMDIQPVRRGQVLVIPRTHVDHFSDLPEGLAIHIFVTAHRISARIRERLKPQRVGLVVHGYGVAHAHMIVVPQEEENDIASGRMAAIENGRIVFSVKHLCRVSRAELDRVAELIK